MFVRVSIIAFFCVGSLRCIGFAEDAPTSTHAGKRKILALIREPTAKTFEDAQAGYPFSEYAVGRYWLEKSQGYDFSKPDAPLLLDEVMQKRGWEWIKRAADKGLPSAQVNMGSRAMKRLTSGKTFETQEALDWFKRAAVQGDVSGQRLLALCYLSEEGAEYRPETARNWFERAANQGDGIAQVQLGQQYESGVGIGRNFDEAYFWFNTALSNLLPFERRYHEADIRAALDRLEQKMTPQQVSRAQIRSSMFVPKRESLPNDAEFAEEMKKHVRRGPQSDL